MMRKPIVTINLAAVIDPSCPWKLSKPRFEFPSYVYRMTVEEWRELLDRAANNEAAVECEVAARYDDGCKDRSGRILVRKSARKAAEWYRRSAEHGFAPAQNNLGVLLGDGRGVDRNPREALAWLRRAFRQGDSSAATNIAVTYRENGFLQLAVRWLRRSALSGDDGAFVQLGVHYFWGKGVRTDHAAAVRCFRKAIKGKNISEADRDDAHFYLGIAYLEGKGVRRSLRMAIRLLKRANIDSDHPPAHKLLRQIDQKLRRRP